MEREGFIKINQLAFNCCLPRKARIGVSPPCSRLHYPRHTVPLWWLIVELPGVCGGRLRETERVCDCQSVALNEWLDKDWFYLSSGWPFQAALRHRRINILIYLLRPICLCAYLQFYLTLFLLLKYHNDVVVIGESYWRWGATGYANRIERKD